jgi:hypothetical protein
MPVRNLVGSLHPRLSLNCGLEWEFIVPSIAMRISRKNPVVHNAENQEKSSIRSAFKGYARPHLCMLRVCTYTGRCSTHMVQPKQSISHLVFASIGLKQSTAIALLLSYLEFVPLKYLPKCKNSTQEDFLESYKRAMKRFP